VTAATTPEVVEFVTLEGDVVAEYNGPFEGMIPALNETMRALSTVLAWRPKEAKTDA